MNHILLPMKLNYLQNRSNVTREEQRQINSKNLSHHGRNIDRINDLTLVEIEKNRISHIFPRKSTLSTSFKLNHTYEKLVTG